MTTPVSVCVPSKLSPADKAYAIFIMRPASKKASSLSSCFSSSVEEFSSDCSSFLISLFVREDCEVFPKEGRSAEISHAAPVQPISRASRETQAFFIFCIALFILTVYHLRKEMSTNCVAALVILVFAFILGGDTLHALAMRAWSV